MARYKILDAAGNVINTIVADKTFVETNFPGQYQLDTPAPINPVLEPKLVSKLSYMCRFTDAELELIYSTAKVNISVEVWLAKFNATTGDIDLNDPRTIAGINALESAGLLGAGRAAEILA